jgi:hypothetical protein
MEGLYFFFGGGAGVIFGLAYSLSISKCGGLKHKGLYWGGGGGGGEGVIFGLAYSLSISKCGGLKHKGLYWGGGFDSEVYSVTKKQ